MALGITRSNTTNDVTNAGCLFDCGGIQVGKETDSLSFLRASAFKVRIFWLPYYVDNELVIDWPESFRMKVREARHEKSVIKGMEHVSIKVREFYVIKYGLNVKEELPDVSNVPAPDNGGCAKQGGQVPPVWAPGRLRGHMHRECMETIDVRPGVGHSPDPPTQGRPGGECGRVV